MSDRPEIEIPTSWLGLTLGNVIDYGKTVKSEPTEIPEDAWVLELEDIEKDTSQLLQRLTFAERLSKSTKNRFAAGDVLYGKLRPYLNKILIADQDGYCTTEIIPIKPNRAIDGRYLFYWFKHPEFLGYVDSVSHGIQMPRLGTEAGLKAPLMLAPLNEQRRIVAKLDRLFASSRRAREELARVSGLCDRYKQALLAAACSGRLTADWRTKQCSEMDWQSTILGELIIGKPKNGYSAKPVNYETSFRVLTLTATTSGKFDPRHFKYFDEIIDEKSPFWLQPGDILVQRGNTIEYVGVAAVYDGIPNQFVFPDLMMRLRAKSGVITQFLYMVLSCEKSRKHLRSKATGTAGNMPKINQPTLVSLPIDLPSIEEQKEIVQRVEKLFKTIDLMEQEYQKASKLCDRLEQATLSKAFRGELVPQNPDDEPAAALLERIRAEKQDQPKGRAVKSKQKLGERFDSSDQEINCNMRESQS
jgi:type I restriction enzyme, S subunit